MKKELMKYLIKEGFPSLAKILGQNPGDKEIKMLEIEKDINKLANYIELLKDENEYLNVKLDRIYDILGEPPYKTKEIKR